ncbi:MAG: helix-turn-helix domain-containing protein [Proteobacteria bacterium]|nr:helix-turn-helix domain-containing protein [Pseudomonadota bacterium]
MSQRELARSAGIVHSQLSRIEAGKTDPSVSALTKLAFALDVPLCGFMGDETTSAADAANGASALTEAEEEILTLYRAASPVDRTQVERLLLLMVGRLAATSSRGRPGLGGPGGGSPRRRRKRTRARWAPQPIRSSSSQMMVSPARASRLVTWSRRIAARPRRATSSSSRWRRRARSFASTTLVQGIASSYDPRTRS